MEFEEFKSIIRVIRQGPFLPKDRCISLASLKLHSIMGAGRVGVRARERINSSFHFDHFPDFSTYIYYKFHLTKKDEYYAMLAVRELSTDKGRIFFIYFPCSATHPYYLVTAHALDRICERLGITTREEALLKVIQELMGKILCVYNLPEKEAFIKSQNLVLLNKFITTDRFFDMSGSSKSELFEVVYTAITPSMLNERQQTIFQVAEKKVAEDNNTFFFDGVRHQCDIRHSFEESIKNAKQVVKQAPAAAAAPMTKKEYVTAKKELEKSTSVKKG